MVTFSRRNSSAFTLVELIVVITILAILGTIGFLSLGGYSSKSRDSTRATNLSLASRGLEVYQVNTGSYPSPDAITGTGQIGGVTIATTGVFGERVAPLVRMDTPPKDPQSSKYLVYGVDINNRQYQIAAAMESSFALNEEDRNIYLTTLLDQAIPLAYAAGKQVARVAGSYQGVVRVGTTLYNTPSLIFFSGGTFSVAPSPIDLANTNTRLITNNGENLPYLNGDALQGATTPVQSLVAVGNTASTLTGVTLTDWSTQSGSIATTLGLPKETIGIAYYGARDYAKVGGGGGGSGGGTNYSVYCGAEDILVGTKYWAACNVGATETVTTYSDSVWNTSPNTVGKFFQWGENVAWDNSSNLGINNACVWNRDSQSCGASAGGAWPASVSDNLSSSDNRWYDWSTTDNRGPCVSGYHVPSRAEWEEAWVALGSNVTTFKNTFKFPGLSGDRQAGGWVDRGAVSFYWTSSPASGGAYSLAFNSGVNTSWVQVTFVGKTLRCIRNS